MGHAITDATIRYETRRAGGAPKESILFVTFTDGEENQSIEYRREQLFDLVKKHEKEGWTFAYLGANQDAYAQGSRVGFSAASTQNFKGDGRGSREAFANLSSSVSRRRDRVRSGERFDNTDLFEGDKSAEADLEKRLSE
jgi:ABC-type glycerol-3-phosphate transport system substrate-binding protein